MSKIYILAGVLCLGGLVIVGFQAISSMMTPGDIVWESITIASSVDPEYLAWVDKISYGFLQSAVTYIIETPIYILLLTMGVLLFIIGGIKSK
jgi:hypothetical protein